MMIFYFYDVGEFFDCIIFYFFSYCCFCVLCTTNISYITSLSHIEKFQNQFFFHGLSNISIFFSNVSVSARRICVFSVIL